jgi:hypothetical protein
LSSNFITERKSSQHTARFRAGTIIPANTGKDSSNNIAVTNIAQTNKGNLCKVIPFALIFKIVVIKFIAPKIEEIPDKCRLNIARSTEAPECDWIPAKGGYLLIVARRSLSK